MTKPGLFWVLLLFAVRLLILLKRDYAVAHVTKSLELIARNLVFVLLLLGLRAPDTLPGFWLCWLFRSYSCLIHLPFDFYVLAFLRFFSGPPATRLVDFLSLYAR